MFSKKNLSFFVFYFMLLVGYSIFSYSLTAPNLVLSNWEPYWNFQLYMWQTFFNDRLLLTQGYLLLITCLFITNFFISTIVSRSSKLDVRKVLLGVLVMSIPLLLSNNALSYDVFNYIFNAKMVVVYQVDPHVETATNYLYDDWTRFMHNTHTPAPYGYGWTIFSLIPYSLGLGKFLLTWLSFRFFSFLSLLLLGITYLYAAQKKLLTPNLLILVLLNPLMLIEIISNTHNDLWMMVPAMWSLLLVSSEKAGVSSFKTVLLSLVLLLLASSIKLATIVLFPLWLALILSNFLQRRLPSVSLADSAYSLLTTHSFLIASILMFVPLLTLRSQQFLPWYLTWVLVWIPFFEQRSNKKEEIKSTLYRLPSTVLKTVEKIWVPSVLVLSLSSMLRYVPYLYAGTYEGDILWQQKMITWVPFVLALIVFTLRHLRLLSTSRYDGR